MEFKPDFTYGAKATQKYLAQHSEPLAELTHAIRVRCPRFGHGLAIPCYEEGRGILHSLATLPPGPLGPVLITVVVNAPRDAAPHVHAANAETLKGFIREYGTPELLAPFASLYPHPAGTILVIDRASQDFLPKRQGVGLARKIGADLLLALTEEHHIRSPWIHCSDADVRFPRDYFEQPSLLGEIKHSALVYSFQHVPAETGAEAASRKAVAGRPKASLPFGDPAYRAGLLYEISLRYYVLGLRFAGSPYAFHSIGSTLAVHANAYAQVRGFPRREAAEDFYLLNKLAKVGQVAPLGGGPLLLSSRTSSRVPFGTGAAIRRLVEPGNSEITAYDPRVFHYLRAWQKALSFALDVDVPPEPLPTLIRRYADEDTLVDFEILVNALAEISAIDRAQAALSGQAKGAGRRIFEGFDGFQTLKLIHTLRDSGLKKLPLHAALEQASFIPSAAAADWGQPEKIAQALEGLEQRYTDRPLDQTENG